MATTAGLTGITRAWLTDPLAPGGASVVCGTRRPSALTRTVDGARKLYAGNRSEVVVYDSGTLDLPITFAALTITQLTQVEAWLGRTLLLRTTDGQRYYGAYLTVNRTTLLRAGPVYDADVTMLAVSYSDTV